MAQSGSVLAWGARGPGFESQYPDMKTATVCPSLFLIELLFKVRLHSVMG
jgi:hypothetical protein